eukprot:TRINITY_DN1087_c0_g1_i4.p1 TRINITY_DN1087_c0_g1~~TRINITY_DN1087_c0_g1_i4.p1  ORF type:complete len:394 (+),score=104.93 TRINITY_DN1087_c0_g1_i4:264-1445(+)
MFGTFLKFGKRVVEKVEDGATKAKTTVVHRINAKRSHSELRDIITESSQMAFYFRRVFRRFTTSTEQMLDFAVKYCVVSKDIEAELLSYNTNFEVTLKEADQALSTWARSLDTLIDEEKKLEAGKEDEKEFSTPESIGAKRLELAVDAVGEYAASNLVVVSVILRHCTAQASKLAAFPEVFESSVQIPFRQLWYDPQPAVGAPPKSAPRSPDGSRMERHEELSSFSQPVDGDTRAKYAKIWNKLVAEVLEEVRLVEESVAEWMACIGRVSLYMTKWQESDPSSEAAEISTRLMSTHHHRLLNIHFGEFQRIMGGVVIAMESLLAPVPEIGLPPPYAENIIPSKRRRVVKDALNALFSSIAVLMSRFQRELSLIQSACIELEKEGGVGGKPSSL